MPQPIKDVESLVVDFFNQFNDKYMRYVPVTSLQYTEPVRPKSVDQVMARQSREIGTEEIVQPDLSNQAQQVEIVEPEYLEEAHRELTQDVDLWASMEADFSPSEEALDGLYGSYEEELLDYEDENVQEESNPRVFQWEQFLADEDPVYSEGDRLTRRDWQRLKKSGKNKKHVPQKLKRSMMYAKNQELLLDSLNFEVDKEFLLDSFPDLDQDDVEELNQMQDLLANMDDEAYQ